MAQRTQLPVPVTRDGNAVRFDDGTEVDVFAMAREWASWREQVLGSECMNPYCDRPATGGVTLYGLSVGRVCDTCRPQETETKVTRLDIYTVLEGIIEADCTPDAFKAAENELIALLDADHREIVFVGRIADWGNDRQGNEVWALIDGGNWLINPGDRGEIEVQVLAEPVAPSVGATDGEAT